MKRSFIFLFSFFLLYAASATASPHDLPIRRIVREAVEPFPGGGEPPAYKLRAGQPGTETAPEDLEFDQATEVGPAIEKILEEVGQDPYAAYLWVKNNVEYEPHHGVKRGAEGVAWEKTGNDFDQAALLASLLRSQGIPTRFVYGVVRLTGSDYADWLGAASANEAFRLAVHGGVPIRDIKVGGIIKFIEVNHVWLEAKLPYANPGQRGEGENVWIPLDPSFKKHTIELGQNLFPSLGFDPEEFLLDYLSLEEDVSPEKAFGDLLLSKLERMGSASLNDAAYTVTIVEEENASMPVDLPSALDVKGIIWEESLLPETYYYRFRITVFSGNNEDGMVSEGDIRATIPTAYLSEHFLSIGYKPATQQDSDLAAASITGSPLDPSIRHLIKLKPVLLVDGKPIGEVLPGDFTESAAFVPDFVEGNIGFTQKLVVETLAPTAVNGLTLWSGVESTLKIGEAYALGASVGTISGPRMQYLTNKLNSLQPEGKNREAFHSAISLTALQYLHRTTTSSQNLASLLGVRSIQEPALIICAMRLKSEGSADSGGIIFDVKTLTKALVSRDGRKDREIAYMFLSGFQSSYLEHKILEEVFGATAVSAIRILKESQKVGMQPLIMESGDVASVQALPMSAGQKNYILERMMGNRRLIIPPQAMTLEKWTGWGYILWDPDTGAAGFMISGGLGGGHSSGLTPAFITKLWLQNMDAMNGLPPGTIGTFVGIWVPSWDEASGKFVKGTLSFVPTAELNTETPYILDVAIWPENFLDAAALPDPESGKLPLAGIELGGSFHSDPWQIFHKVMFAAQGLKYRVLALSLKELNGSLSIQPLILYGKGETPPVEFQPNQRLEAETIIKWTLEDSSKKTLDDTQEGSLFIYKRDFCRPPSELLQAAMDIKNKKKKEGADEWIDVVEPHKAFAALTRPPVDEDLLQDLSLNPSFLSDLDSTKISFYLKQDARVRITVRDETGVVYTIEDWTERAGLEFYADNVCCPAGCSTPNECDAVKWIYDGTEIEPGKYTVVVEAITVGSKTPASDIHSTPITLLGGCDNALSDVSLTPKVTAYPIGTLVAFTIASGLEGPAKVELSRIDTGEKLDVGLELSAGPSSLLWDGGEWGTGGRVSAPDGHYSLSMLLTAPNCAFKYPEQAVPPADPLDVEIDGSIAQDDPANRLIGKVVFPKEPINIKATNVPIEFMLTTDQLVNVRFDIIQSGGKRISSDVIAVQTMEPQTVNFPLAAESVGIVDVEIIAFRFDNSQGLYQWDKQEGQILIVGPSATFPATPLTEIFPYEIGKDVGQNKVWWPANLAVKAGGDVVDAVMVRIFAASDTALQTPLDTVGFECSHTPTCILGEAFPNAENFDGGWYKLKITAAANKYKDLWTGVVGATVGDDLRSDPPLIDLKGYSPLWHLAPNKSIAGLNGDSALLSFSVSDAFDPYFIALAPKIWVENDWSPYGFAAEDAFFEDQMSPSFFWYWNKGLDGNTKGEVFDPQRGAIYSSVSSVGKMGVLAVDESGKYTKLELNAQFDSSAEEIDAVTNIDFETWRVRIPVKNGEPVAGNLALSLRVNVPGLLTLKIIGDHSGEVRTLFADAAVGTGLHSYKWNLRGDAPPGELGLVVPDDAYRINANIKPFQSDPVLELGPFEGGSLRVRFDTDKLRDVGRRRGKAFSGGVDVATGNSFLQTDDISLPVNAHGFKWTRYYNSQDDREGELGVGWRHRYEVRLVSFHGGSKRLIWGDGHGELFTPRSGICDGGAVYSTDFCSDPESLNTLKEGSIDSAWELETPEGVLKFDDNGYLTDGWGLAFTYADCDSNTKKVLKHISGPNGLSATITDTFSDCRIDRVLASTTGAPSVAVDYGYTPKSSDSVVNNQVDYLSSVTNRLGASAYGYLQKVSSDGYMRDTDGTRVKSVIYHWVMTASAGPLEGGVISPFAKETAGTRYYYDEIQETEKDTNGIRLLTKRFAKIGSIVHQGQGSWSWKQKGLTNYTFTAPEVEISTQLGTENITNEEYETGKYRLKTRIDANANATTMTWGDHNLLQSTKDGTNVISWRDYLNGTDWVETEQLVSAASGLGLRTSAYNADGTLQTSTDAEGNISHYEYFYAADLSTELAADLGVLQSGDYQFANHRQIGTKITITTYRPDDPATPVIDEKDSVAYDFDHGYKTYRWLDADGRAVKEQDALGNVWLMKYDDRGNLRLRIDPRGHETAYAYDAWDRVASETVAFTEGSDTGAEQSRTVCYTYDGVGNRKRSYFKPVGVECETNTIEKTGLAQAILDNTIATYEYDGGNRLLREKDRWGKLSRENERSTGANGTGWVTASYDMNRNRTDFTHYDNGQVHTQVRDPGTGPLTTTYNTYDARGNNTKMTDARGGEWTSTFDAAGRLETSTDPLANATTYTYFPDGDRETVSANGHLRASYETNEAGMVVAEGRPYLDAADVKWTSYKYDQRGNRTKVIDALLNETTYVYRPDNLLDHVVDPFGQTQKSLAYYEAPSLFAGLTKTEIDYNGRTTRFEYDTDLPTAPRYRMTKVWDAHHIPTVYAYDDLSRVINEARAGIDVDYGYDANSNKVRVEGANGRITYSIYDQANRLKYQAFIPDASTDYTDLKVPTFANLTIPAEVSGTGSVDGRIDIVHFHRIPSVGFHGFFRGCTELPS